MLKHLRDISLVSLVALALPCQAAFAAGAQTQPQPVATFFTQFVVAGGSIVWFILLPMSVVAVALIIQYSLTIRRKILLPDGSGRRIAMLLSTRSLSELPHTLSRRQDMLSLAVVGVIAHTSGERAGTTTRSLLTEALQERAFGLMRKIEWLNLLGNVSPMIGLFGTVVGTITSLDALSQSGGLTSAPRLAGGIAVALVTTYWGLIIAIPALSAYGILRNRIEAIAGDAALEAEALVPHLARLLEPQTATDARPAAQPGLPLGKAEGQPQRPPVPDTIAETAP
jgi:biopolymer transport protein ExbB